MAGPDFSKLFNTHLSPPEESKFQAWVKAHNRQADLRDYDLRGWWKNDRTQADNGHFTDKYKKPNHPTFSSDSQYSSPSNPGGTWKQAPDGTWTFIASPANLQYRSAADLKNYFSHREQGNRLVFGAISGDETLSALAKALRR